MMGCRELDISNYYRLTSKPQNSYTRALPCTEKTPYTGFSYTVIPNYRFYAPDLGRWTKRDDIGERGAWNLYGFVDNSPLNWWDKAGRDAWEDMSTSEKNKKRKEELKKEDVPPRSGMEYLIKRNIKRKKKSKRGLSRDHKCIEGEEATNVFEDEEEWLQKCRCIADASLTKNVEAEKLYICKKKTIKGVFFDREITQWIAQGGLVNYDCGEGWEPVLTDSEAWWKQYREWQQEQIIKQFESLKDKEYVYDIDGNGSI